MGLSSGAIAGGTAIWLRTREVFVGRKLPTAIWVAPAALFALVPGLLAQVAQSAIHAFRPEIYWVETSIVLVSMALTAVLLYFLAFERNVRRSVGTASVLILVGFTWPIFGALGQGAQQLVDITYVEDVVVVLVTGALVWLAVKYGDRDGFVVVATGVGIGLLFAFSLVLVPRIVGDPIYVGPPTRAGPHPDTVVLILDGYARQDILESDFESEGPSLASALRDRGFLIRDDAISNYSMTYASVSSMLAMDYSFGEGVRTEASLERMRRLLSGDSPLVSAFHDAGYAVTALENAWSGSHCGRSIDDCHRTGLIGRSLWSLGEMSPLASVQSLVVPNPFVVVGLQHIRELGPLVEAESTAPRLIVAHVTVPHPPLQLDSSCTIRLASDRTRLTMVPVLATSVEIDTARERFLEQTRCIDREVLATVDQLLANDPDLAMLIVSDHGPESRAQHAVNPADWNDDALIERMAVISALRVPSDCDDREPARTTINTIRHLANCTIGTELENLPDRNYLVPHESDLEPPVVDVTGRLNSIGG